MNPRRSRKLSDARRRELEVCAALAREAVNQFHVDSAISMIGLAEGRVPADRMLDIYLRVHGLSGADAEVLSYSVLAALGHRGLKGVAAKVPVDGDAEPNSERSSVFGMIRRRLKGRVHHDLRRWVELATGAAQAGIMDIHVRHAMVFTRELADSHSVAQVCELYAHMAGVPSRLEEMLYVCLLDRLAADELPFGKDDAVTLPRRVALLPRGPRRVI